MSAPELTVGATLYGVDGYAHYSTLSMTTTTVLGVGGVQVKIADRYTWSDHRIVISTEEARQRLTPEGAWSLFIGEYDAKVRAAEAALRRAEEGRATALNARGLVMGVTP